MNGNIKYLLLNTISLVSLIVFPHRFSKFVSLLFDYIASTRFKILTNNSGQAYMERPFQILGHKYVTFDSFYSHAGLRIECWDKYCNTDFNPSVIIGKNVCFNYRCHIGAIDKIVIGNNVLVGSNVLIIDHSHGYNDSSDINISPSERELYSKGPVIIEDDVWIGENACILPNVRIGHNSIIGANSVVTKNIPPYSIAVGNPASVVKTMCE